MVTQRWRHIENWEEADLSTLPDEENDNYEYKSSRIRDDKSYRSKLQREIQVAASAFWNTGGGLLVVGVDDNGHIDGGIPAKFGGQRLRDWVDQAIAGVRPMGDYCITTIEPAGGASRIEQGCMVLVIGFEESYVLPHMSADNRYYLRAGAHSSPAGHYLVEAMRSRRGLFQPMLRGLLRMHERKAGVLELAVLTVNEIPALDVTLTLNPLPRYFAQHDIMHNQFPLLVPVIDHQNPFRMDLTTVRNRRAWLGDAPVHLELTYRDLAGRSFSDRQLIDHRRSISQVELTARRSTFSEKTLDKMLKEMKKLRHLIDTKLPDSSSGSSPDSSS